MTFAAPLLLAGLALVPVLAVAYLVFDRRVRRTARTHVAAPLRPAVLPRAVGWRRHVPVVGGLTAAALLLVAIARPQTTVAVPVSQARVMMVLDRSGSMLAKDAEPDRLTAAKRAAGTFLDEVRDDVRVGAITFNQEPTVLATPTRDHEAVREAVDGIRAAGTTATGDALARALQVLKDDDSPTAIILLSDGKSVRGTDLMAVARQAKAAKIPVYTVSLGTAGGTITTPQGTSNVPPDTAAMREVAQITGGRAFATADAEQLKTVYERLSRQVATERQQRDVSSLFAGGALLVLFGGTVTSLALTGRPF